MVFYPVCLFCYNRPKELKETIEYLSLNLNFNKTELYVFCDGPKDNDDKIKTDQVRDIAKNIIGAKNIKIEYNSKNIGLANSIINGVDKILKKYSAVIVLEDDLITSNDFINYMNLNLNKYQNQKSIFSINAYSHNLKSLSNYKYDNYFLFRSSSWGWGTWRNRWNKVIWDKNYYKNISIYEYLKLLKGGLDLPFMLRNYINGKIDSWAIRFVYSQIKENGISSVSTISKIKNIGFNDFATNTKFSKENSNYLNTQKKIFNLCDRIEVNRNILKDFLDYYSLFRLIKRKIFK